MPHLHEPPCKLRFRVDRYDKSIKNYKPYKGKALIIPVANPILHRPMWRAFVKWMESGAWKLEITPEEQELVNISETPSNLPARDWRDE